MHVFNGALFMKSFRIAGLLCLALVGASPSAVSIVRAQAVSPVDAAISFREETLAYTAGLQGYVYGYPAVDYLALMKAQTTPGARDHARVNSLFNFGKLMVPGEGFAGRAPNNDTIYFYGWLDLSGGPLVVSTPAVPDGRYHALTFADLYSEVQHTGSRVTGNNAHKVIIAGPGWKGKAPRGSHLIQLRTHHGFVLGRILATGPADEKAANELILKYRLEPLDRKSNLPVMPELPTADALRSLSFFHWLNVFLRDNPRLPGEEVLMAQLDQAGFGPGVRFDESRLTPAARRGLERAIADARKLIAEKRFTGERGWSRPSASAMGVYGFDYLQRAYIEQIGLLANLREESVYPTVFTDANGELLNGARSYRLRFPADRLPPVDAFWSLTAYDAAKVDFVPNEINRYSIGDRTSGLVRGADGSIEITISKTRPANVANWLPVGEGRFILTMRMYRPRAEVLDGRYVPPSIEVLP